MNALQSLIQAWLDEEPGRSVRRLAAKSGLPAATVDAIRSRDVPKSLPRDDTLRKLARGLDQPYQVVKNAAVEAVGYRVTDLTAGDQKHRAWVALVDDLTDRDQELLWEIGTSMLRRMQDAETNP